MENYEMRELICRIYQIYKDVFIMEFYSPIEKCFEYYLKDSNNDYEYQFGVTERFSINQLKELYDQGYFS